MYPFSSIAKRQRVGQWVATQQQQQRQGQGREVQFPYDPREELPFVAAGRVERSRQQTRNEGSSDCPFPLRSVSPSGPQDDDRSTSLRDAILNVNPRTLQQMRPYEDPGKLDRFANTQLAQRYGGRQPPIRFLWQSLIREK